MFFSCLTVFRRAFLRASAAAGFIDCNSSSSSFFSSSFYSSGFYAAADVSTFSGVATDSVAAPDEFRISLLVSTGAPPLI